MTDSIEHGSAQLAKCAQCGGEAEAQWMCEHCGNRWVMLAAGEAQAITTARKAIMCLLLEVPPSVWADAMSKVEAAFWAQAAHIRELEAKVAKLETTATIAGLVEDKVRLDALDAKLWSVVSYGDKHWEVWGPPEHDGRRTLAHKESPRAALDSARQATEDITVEEKP